MSLAVATGGLTAYLLGSATGIVTGGFLAARSEHNEWHYRGRARSVRHDGDRDRGSGCAARWMLLPLMVLMGFGVGVAGPNRDLLVRRAATSRFGKAAFGRVYGFVYSGLDTGLALSPLLFGPLLDAGHSRRRWWRSRSCRSRRCDGLARRRQRARGRRAGGARMSSAPFATTDLLDAHEAEVESGRVQVLQPGLIALGRVVAFSGEVVTLETVRGQQPAGGSGQAARRRAVSSSSMRAAACAAPCSVATWPPRLRRTAGPASSSTAVRATPTKSMPAQSACVRWRLTRGDRSSAARVSATCRWLSSASTIRPGHWLYADRDGVIVSDTSLH